MPPKKPTGHIWNLENANLLSVIDEVSKETGKNFVIDPRVSGQVTLISTTPLGPKELYQVFLTILNAYGYSAIPNGNITKIVPSVNVAQDNTPVSTTTRPGRGSEVVTRVISIKNVSATQLIPVLRPLMPQWAELSAYTPTNSLILTGSANNLSRLVKIVKEIDSPEYSASVDASWVVNEVSPSRETP